MNIAILLIEVNNNSLMGGGGAERFFADLYDVYNKQSHKKHNLYFLTDEKTVEELHKISRLSYVANILSIKLFNNRFKYLIESLELVYFIIFKRIQVIHIALYNQYYNRRINFLNKLPLFVRPKIVVQIVDSQVPYFYSDPDKHKHFTHTYSELFNDVKFDGIYTWYLLFKEFVEKDNLIKCKPYIEAVKGTYGDAKSSFSDTIKNILNTYQGE